MSAPIEVWRAALTKRPSAFPEVVCADQCPLAVGFDGLHRCQLGFSTVVRTAADCNCRAPLSEARGCGEFGESEFGSQPAAHFCDGLIHFGHPSGGDDE